MRYGFVIGATLLSVCATGVFAQDAKQREPTMKDIGRAFSDINKMNRGQSPYDAAAAKAAFDKISASAKTFGTLFGATPTPEGRALPAIWENKADFDSRVAKLASDAHAGAATKDEAAFKTAFATLGGNCAGCHDKYRGKE
jgi:cytochrome c556